MTVDRTKGTTMSYLTCPIRIHHIEPVDGHHENGSIRLHLRAHPQPIEIAPGTTHEGITMTVDLAEHTFAPDGIFPRVWPNDRLHLTLSSPDEPKPDDETSSWLAYDVRLDPALEMLERRARQPSAQSYQEQRRAFWEEFVAEASRAGLSIRLVETEPATPVRPEFERHVVVVAESVLPIRQEVARFLEVTRQRRNTLKSNLKVKVWAHPESDVREEVIAAVNAAITSDQWSDAAETFEYDWAVEVQDDPKTVLVGER